MNGVFSNRRTTPACGKNKAGYRAAYGKGSFIDNLGILVTFRCMSFNQRHRLMPL